MCVSLKAHRTAPPESEKLVRWAALVGRGEVARGEAESRPAFLGILFCGFQGWGEQKRKVQESGTFPRPPSLLTSFTSPRVLKPPEVHYSLGGLRAHRRLCAHRGGFLL